jgi:hypothetical protein
VTVETAESKADFKQNSGAGIGKLTEDAGADDRERIPKVHQIVQ